MSQSTPAKPPKAPQTVGELMRLLSKTPDPQSRQALVEQVLAVPKRGGTTH